MPPLDLEYGPTERVLMFMVILVLCTEMITGGINPGDPLEYCPPTQMMNTWFPTDCISERDLMREQQNAFVLSVDCFERIEPPAVKVSE